MLDLRSLSLRVLGAPMAGGPSTPALVAAVTHAGGIGLLAGGSTSVDAVREAMRATRVLLGVDRPAVAPDREAASAMHDPTAQEPAPFGVNLFVPRSANTVEAAIANLEAHRAAVETYAAMLSAAFATDPADLGHADPLDDDDWDRKLDLLESEPVALVTFTFGLPEPGVFGRLHAVGTACGVTVTNGADAVAAVEAGADLVIAQGAEAGGHRSTWRVVDVPNDDDTLTVVRAVRDALDRRELDETAEAASLGDEAARAEAGTAPVALVAAGGIDGAERMREALGAGADAVQVGTALLLADEAGTPPTFRRALTDVAFAETVVTRVFSGRPARALRTEFVDAFDAIAPAAYPDVNQLTRPLRARAEAAGDARVVSSYAGTRWRSSRAEPVARILRRFTPGEGAA